MEAKELRIGNFIFDEGGIVKEVEGISGKGSIHEEIRLIFFKDQQHSNFSRACKPIPLTEEWLLKFGFEKRGDFLHKDLLNDWTKIYFNLSHGIICELSINRHSCVIKCESVHQLQNLVYAITGEELTIKE